MFRNKLLSEALADGVWFERDPLCLTREEVDPELRDTIFAINRTARFLTRYCCEGHVDREREKYTAPYIQLVCRNHDLATVMLVAVASQKAAVAVCPDLHVSVHMEAASPNWTICSIHAFDPYGDVAESLPAARQAIIDFGCQLSRHKVR